MGINNYEAKTNDYCYYAFSKLFHQESMVAPNELWNKNSRAICFSKKRFAKRPWSSRVDCETKSRVSVSTHCFNDFSRRTNNCVKWIVNQKPRDLLLLFISKMCHQELTIASSELWNKIQDILRFFTAYYFCSVSPRSNNRFNWIVKQNKEFFLLFSTAKAS